MLLFVVIQRAAACYIDTHLPVSIIDREEKRRIESMALRSRLVASTGIVTVVGRLFDSLAAGGLLPKVPLLYPPAFRGNATVRRVNSAQQNQPTTWSSFSPPRQTRINVLNIGLAYPTWQQQSNAISATAATTQRRRESFGVDRPTVAAARSSHSAMRIYQQSPTINASSMATSREQQQQQLQQSHESATKMLNPSQRVQRKQQQPIVWNRRR